MPEPSPQAFISYSRNDSDFALRLAQDLKTAGARVWLDQLDIRPGVPWDNAIETALSESPVMLLVLSPDSAKSDNVRNEISFALEEGKVIIPVLYADCTVPLRLQRAQRIDFRADYAHGLSSLLAYLQVANPNTQVLDKAAEGDAQRQVAWQAREAEAQRLRELNQARDKEEAERQKAEAERQRVEAEAARLAEKARADAASKPAPPFTPVPPAPSPRPAPSGPPPVAARPPAPVAPPVRPATRIPPPNTGFSEHTSAWVAYLTVIPAVIFLAFPPYKNSAFVRFHALQSISFAATLVCGDIVFSILPGIGKLLLVALVMHIIQPTIAASHITTRSPSFGSTRFSAFASQLSRRSATFCSPSSRFSAGFYCCHFG